MEEKEPLLLVTCCAPCSAYIIDCLKDTFNLTLYFYNPNIQPRHEYELRKFEIACYASSLQIPFIEGPYDVERWHEMTQAVKNEPEGGFRCEVCFRLRINRACLYAVEHGIRVFTTTFAMSPYKNKIVVNKVCNELAHSYGVKYFDHDFRKNDGFKISMQMAKIHDFYLQKYCGCIYSLQEAEEKQHKRRLFDAVADIPEHVPLS